MSETPAPVGLTGLNSFSERNRPLSRLVLAVFALVSLTFSPLVAQHPDPVQREELKEPEKEKEPRPNEEERKREEPPPDQKPPQPAPPQPAPGEPPAKPQPEADEKSKDEEKKWDVSNPPLDFTEVSIDTREGTWMSLDVSPDGKEIVFDLLGDLYTIPISGGEAKALTSGVEWDMQPRYSPNGRWIAFTSDRAGGDNIWIVKRDGSDPQQVSKETFRLLNSPSWSPDSEFLVARKHFTSRRSLGAGEMWLYHRSGGEGVQLTEKANDQKDAGEPVFSPDGRYLYFSQDVTPGRIFEYNKDPNGQIYVIQRLDRERGDIERYITGPGGSVRPTPSPDGKQLAFVRRVRGKSVLYLTDLESGSERPLFDGLDRDMQETWAIHGVYPTMAWTPDNRSIVFWAAGKIHRIDAGSREVSAIPFHVKATRKVAKALRFPIEVAPDSFPVRMLRWVQVSPSGRQVVYQALGHLYVRDLPNGTPRRLTRQTDHLEFYPSYSRDGRSIVYTTWDDQTFGSIRVVSAGGGEGRVVTVKPGHYLEPVFTPDGTSIVYRASSDGYLRPAVWGREQGLFVIPARGGKPERLHKDGFLPQFGAASDRVYFMAVTDSEKDTRAFQSIELDGSDERTHLQSDEATEFRISPDENWIAFTENFNAYIAPFIEGAKSLKIGPKEKSIPIRKVSRDAGEYLHWSGDGSRLYWALGPELFSRDLRDAFEFVDGAPEELPKEPETGANIGFEKAKDVPTGAIALVGGRVITMREQEVIENGTVVVRGDRIVAVGPRAGVAVPADARVYDVSGKTILPGLIDVHWHGSMGTDEIIPEQSWVNYSSLAFGVTTIHDPSNDTSEIFAASEMARAGMLTGPRIFSTGTILYGAKAPFRAVIESLEDARAHLRRMKAVGAFSVKSYNQPRRDQRQQVIAAANELGMMVVPEGGSLFQHNMTMVVDGHTGIEHSIPVARIYDDTFQLWSQSGTGYTPTLVVGYGGIWGENYWYQTTEVWANERLLAFVPRRFVDSRARRRMLITDEEFNHFNNARIAGNLVNRGVSVQLGAHGQREGLGAHWELWMFEQGGMTPLQALRSATLSGAQYLGLDRDLGSLENGKLADLIVLDRNPLENIRNSESVAYTMVGGRLYEATTMNQIGNHPRQRATFWFEVDGNEGWSPAAAEAIENHRD
jgi:Tol biopolymer transport system component/imidazolonepropionase-like amidohydrolase